MSDISRLRQYWANPNVQAFARAVRFCEGTSDEDGYRRMFGGKLFTSFADHPREAQTFKLRKGGSLTSTAAGAYQYLSRTWDGLVKQYKFPNFGKEYQDLGFVALVDGRKALMDLVRGDLPTVVRKCALEWASLPGSPYGQPTKTHRDVLEEYLKHGGKLEPAGEAPVAPTIAPLSSEPLMPPILIPLVKMGLLEAVPKLLKLFGSGTEVSERNIKAIEAVADIAKAATGAKNEQELLEVMKVSPEAVQQVQKAVEENWYQLQEVGGGVQEARKQDLEIIKSSEHWSDLFKSPSFVIGAFGLLPLVYLIVLSLIGVVGNAEWSMEVRASIAGLIVGTIVGGLVGYYYGQTTSRNRTPTNDR